MIEAQITGQAFAPVNWTGKIKAVPRVGEFVSVPNQGGEYEVIRVVHYISIKLIKITVH